MNIKIRILAILSAALFVVASTVIMGQPVINTIADSPDPVEVPGYNNITADITNATSAYVEIYYPNSTLEGNHTMAQNSTGIWYYNGSYAYPDPLGLYNYTVKANNATGWVASSTSNFTLQDTTDPSSSVNTLPQYWYNVNASITATASDNYNLQWVKLKYRYSSDNSSWNSWNDFSTDYSPPWQWNFNFTSGEGYYRFLTIARDSAGNTESWPPVFDENVAYDVTPPTSNVDAMAYWHNSLPVIITATASDNLSGVKDVTLYYRYSLDNSSWNSWAPFATDISSPWQWNFNAPDGDGYYRFYTIAKDNSTNTESIPSIFDENAGIDTHTPSTSIHATSSCGTYISSSSLVTLSANDVISGVNSSYYRIWNDSWYPLLGTGVGKGNNFYFYTGAFSLSKSGTNYVEYYSDDNVRNEETTHNRTYNVDNIPPAISNIVPDPPTQISGGYVDISCTVTDGGAGVDKVYLEVTYPDSSFSNFTMKYSPCTTYYRNETYSIVGTYDFTIYATDKLGNAVRSSVSHFTISSANTPPNIPSKPSGASSGNTGMSYTYSTATTDSDGDNVYYLFDWGDSSNSGWVGPYSSGYTGSAAHSWSNPGTYYVKAKAKDAHDAESGWSASSTVTLTSPNNPPVTTYTLDPSTPTGKNGWNIGDVNVTLNATDIDGDAIAYTKYRIDGGGWNTYAGTFTISGDGKHLLEFYSADDKGNVESAKSVTIKIDISGPSVTLQRPLTGYLYLFDRQIFPLATGNTVIIGRIVVRAVAYDAHSDIENVSFYVNGTLQNIDMVYPYEWLWGGDIGYKYLRAVSYNKAGFKEETVPILVYIFSFYSAYISSI